MIGVNFEKDGLDYLVDASWRLLESTKMIKSWFFNLFQEDLLPYDNWVGAKVPSGSSNWQHLFHILIWWKLHCPPCKTRISCCNIKMYNNEASSNVINQLQMIANNKRVQACKTEYFLEKMPWLFINQFSVFLSGTWNVVFPYLKFVASKQICKRSSCFNDI